MKVAIIHYWLVTMRGGEKVLEALCELFPNADIYTHVYDAKKISPIIKQHKIYTTSISKLPNAKKWYQKYLPFMPSALESLDLSSYDLIISSESGPAKGVVIPSTIPHVCYCHTPMRYLWDYYHHYIKESSPFVTFFFKLFAPYLRLWDVASANRVSSFIANSHFVKNRINSIYHRQAEVIYPPVDVEAFTPAEKKEDFYLFLGQLVGYKRADLAIEAFKINGKPLVIIGGGKVPKNLPKNITIKGFVSDTERSDYLAKAQALIFPGEEDFGIVPVEAIASGTPVLAYAKGGALETVKENISGIFFKEQTASAINEAIEKFESNKTSFNPSAMQKSVRQFSRKNFLEKTHTHIQRVVADYALNRRFKW